MALDFDYYEEQGYNRSLIVSTLKERDKDYDPKVTKSLSDLIVIAAETLTLQELKIEEMMRHAIISGIKIRRWLPNCRRRNGVDGQLLKVIRNYNSCYGKSFSQESTGYCSGNLIK